MDENRELETELEDTAEMTAESEDTESAETENTAPATEKTVSPAKKLLADILDIAESTFATVFVMVMIFTYLLHPVNVEGSSMNPTLNNSDRILMTTVYSKLKYGDIVIINNDAVYLLDENGKAYNANLSSNPLDECIIKRVIACEGQTININNSDPDRANWTVEVDGKVLDEPYIMENAFTEKRGCFDGQFPITIPEGYCFVMGDNRNNSSDSRNGYVGLIKKEQIYGKALVRYAPFSDFKFLINSYKESASK